MGPSVSSTAEDHAAGKAEVFPDYGIFIFFFKVRVFYVDGAGFGTHYTDQAGLQFQMIGVFFQEEKSEVLTWGKCGRGRCVAWRQGCSSTAEG